MGRVYTKLKIFNFPEKISSLPKDDSKILPPLQVRLKPTNVCNHHCSYCAYRLGDLQLGKDMETRDSIPREKMMELIDDFIAIGVKAVTFSGGGEPFVYPYIVETIRKLAESRVKFAALTNGSRLEGELAEIFACRGTWVRVSIDGWDARSYAAYRNVSENEFGKVLSNMEAFNRLNGSCFLSTIINVDHQNAPHVGELIQRLTDIGVKSIKVAPVIFSNDSDENDRHHQAYYDMVYEVVEKSRISSPKVEIFNCYHPQSATFAKSYDWCPYIQIRPVVAADQNVYSCHDKAYNTEQGLLFSIRDQRFRDVWFEDKDLFFRINPQKVCNHHCMVNDHNKLILEYLDIVPEHMEFV